MRSPWKRLNPTEPGSGSKELSIGLLWLMSLRHNSKNKQGARREVDEEGMRWEKHRMGVREGTLAVREYLLRDDGREEG